MAYKDDKKVQFMGIDELIEKINRTSPEKIFNYSGFELFLSKNTLRKYDG